MIVPLGDLEVKRRGLRWLQRGSPQRYAEPAMTTRELLARISIDPQVCFGKPCIRGHRIWVSLILDLLAGGASIEEILADYPSLKAADVRACLAYGAEMVSRRNS